MTTDARKIGFNVLVAIAFYLPLEDFVLRWLPLPLGFITALRQTPEVLVWLVALAASAIHLMRYGSIRIIGRRVDLFLMGFIGIAVLSFVLNGAEILAAASSLKALLRYIPLIYALIMLAPDDEQLSRIPRVLVAAFLIQLGVGIVEWLGGQPARAFFSVVHAWGGYSFVGVALDTLRNYEAHDITGTIARPMGYAYFILVGLIVWVVRNEKRPILYSVGVCLALLMTFESHSRMAVFATFLIVVMHQVSLRGFTKTVWTAVLLLPLVGMITLSMGTTLADQLYFLDVFTEEYQEHALTQRLGLVSYILPYTFEGGISMFGYSPDQAIVAAAVGRYFDLPTVLAFVFVPIMEDVYWLALLLYYGFLGFALFALYYGKLTWMVARLYRGAINNASRMYTLTALLLLLLAIPLNAINQTFEMRQFSYYLWLYVGMAIAATENALHSRREHTGAAA